MANTTDMLSKLGFDAGSVSELRYAQEEDTPDDAVKLEERTEQEEEQQEEDLTNALLASMAPKSKKENKK